MAQIGYPDPLEGIDGDAWGSPWPLSIPFLESLGIPRALIRYPTALKNRSCWLDKEYHREVELCLLGPTWTGSRNYNFVGTNPNKK